MLCADFIAEFRRVMDDIARGYLWADDEIVRYLNSAVEEACERAKLIEDRTTPDCCSLDISAGEAQYPLHESVLHVKRLALNGRPLDETSEEELDCESRGWEARSGAPRAFFTVNQTQVRLVPTPTADATLALTVYRRPLSPIDPAKFTGKEEIEIPVQYHLRLMPWVYRSALLKNDAETINPVKAADFEAQFERAFGKRPDANVQRKRRDKRPPVVRCNW